MKAKVYFKETQRMIIELWWVALIMLVGTCNFFYGINKQIINGIPWGNNPGSDITLMIGFGIFLFFTIVIACLRLELQIKEDGVYVKFFPFHLVYKKYEWTEISKSFVLSVKNAYNHSTWKGIKTYQVSFSMWYLQLGFVSGKKLFIQTKKPKELHEVLKSIGKLQK